MAPFVKRKVEIASHWIAFIEHFSLRPSEFYEGVEGQIKSLEIPGIQTERVEFTEGGLLSHKRTYLRLVRERLVFDVCAAPFGKGFFFSCRTAIIPAVVNPLELLILNICILSGFYVVIEQIGFLMGSVILLCGGLIGLYVMRNAIALGLHDLDRALIRTPLLGPIYEAWVRKETYYREDTRLMYLDLVPRIVKELAEEATASKGLKLTQEYLRAPILGELYRSISESPETSRRSAGVSAKEVGETLGK